MTGHSGPMAESGRGPNQRKAIGNRGGSLQIRSNAARMQAMGVSVTIRDLPDDVRDELAARAARQGQSLQEYLRLMLVESASRPPLADVLARARQRVERAGAQVDAQSILTALETDRR